MLKSLSYLYYTILAYAFYHLGDLFWRIPINICFMLYQKCMILSVRYDDLSGNKIWKTTE